METTEKRSRGRPPGRDYTMRLGLKLRPEDDTRARALAKKWGVSVAGAIRRALEETAKREKIT